MFKQILFIARQNKKTAFAVISFKNINESLR